MQQLVRIVYKLHPSRRGYS